MKTYHVTIPITGIIYKTVEAESGDDAIEKALESELKTEDIEEWEAHKIIVRGNVFGGHTNEASAMEDESE